MVRKRKRKLCRRAGANLDPAQSLAEAWLTVKREWAGPLDEAGPEPPALQLGIDLTPQAQGQITQPQDGYGNWALAFSLSATETAVDFAPEVTDTGEPRILYWDVTLLTDGGLTLRPWIGTLRMLPDVYAQVERAMLAGGVA